MSAFLRSAITAIDDYRAELGETPVWCQRTQSLLWVDILNLKLLRYWPSQHKTEMRKLPSLTSAVLLTSALNRFLLVSQDGLHLYDYAFSKTEKICDYVGREGTRTNEAAIAPDGSLWFSTMDLKEEQTLGAWYRYESGAPQPELMIVSMQSTPVTGGSSVSPWQSG